MTAEQAWDSIVLLLRGPEIDQLKTDNAPLMKRLVFPFEFPRQEGILSDREKILTLQRHFCRQVRLRIMMEDAAYSWGLVKGRVKLRGENSWLRASEYHNQCPQHIF